MFSFSLFHLILEQFLRVACLASFLQYFMRIVQEDAELAEKKRANRAIYESLREKSN